MNTTAGCHHRVARASLTAPFRSALNEACRRAGRVYPCRSESVKQFAPGRIVRLGLLAAAVGSACAAGCAAPQRAAPPRRVGPTSARPQPVGVWYYLPAGASDPAQLSAALERDFSLMAQLGLDTVVLRVCPADSLTAVCRAAQRHDLQVVAPDAAAARYVRSGLGRDHLLSTTKEMPPHPALAGRFVGAIVNAQTNRRASAVVEAARSAEAPRAIWAQLDWPQAKAADVAPIDVLLHDVASPQDKLAPMGAPAGGVQTVLCRELRGEEETTARGWLAAFHQGLLNGQTGGLLFDSFRALPGKFQGLVDANKPISPERAAMVRRIAGRASAWRGVLAGLRPDPAVNVPTPQPELRVGLLVSESRRCLLVVNQSATKFVHSKLTCPAAVGRGPVVRAVGVPTAENMLPGAVHTVQDGTLTIPLDLPPGEAALFELF